MSDAPTNIWAYAGSFKLWREKYPEHAKSTNPTEYIRKDVSDAMVAKAREDALREAASLSWLCFHKCDVEVDVVTADDILALIDRTAEGEA